MQNRIQDVAVQYRVQYLRYAYDLNHILYVLQYMMNKLLRHCMRVDTPAFKMQYSTQL